MKVKKVFLMQRIPLAMRNPSDDTDKEEKSADESSD
jgi:hypothetical protein